MHAAIMLLAVTTATADLSDAQHRQLATAHDKTAMLDEAALYPLLGNALVWSKSEAGAVIPDYEAIYTSPGSYRGRLFLIEGLFIRSLAPGAFARPGPWQATWRQWVIQWGPKAPDVVVVYLVDPPGGVRCRQQVRLPARFYKVWRDVDQHGEQTDYLVFVGKGALLGASPNELGTWQSPVIAGALLVLLAVVFIVLRLKVVRMKMRSAPARPTLNGTDTDLPDDPAKAMEELQRRHEVNT